MSTDQDLRNVRELDLLFRLVPYYLNRRDLDENYQPPERPLIRVVILNLRTNRLSVKKYPAKTSLESEVRPQPQ